MRRRKILTAHKDAVALAVRTPLISRQTFAPDGFAGCCLYAAEIGRRVLLDHAGLRTRIVAGDFLRPLGDGLAHSYTLSDGRLSVGAGAYHAWLITDEGDLVDFSAWEAPNRVERQGGEWTGPRPDYLWQAARKIEAKGYRPRPDAGITRTLTNALGDGANGDLLAEMTRESIAWIERHTDAA